MRVVALAALVLAAGMLGATSAPAAHAQSTCESTGFAGMTAAVVNPTHPVSGTVDAAGCDIGVFYGHGHHGTIIGAHISGATAFGVVVAGANVTISKSSVTNIPGARGGGDEGGCEEEGEEGDTGGCSGGGGSEGAGEGGEFGYIGSRHGTGILVTDGGKSTITGDYVASYGRRGISVSGPGAMATITGNTITGSGPNSGTGMQMGQSGVWIANGGMAVISYNTISNNLIVGSGPASNAIMVAGGSAHNGQPNYTTGIQISGNVLRNNVIGVLLSNLPVPSTPTSNRVDGNTITLSVTVPPGPGESSEPGEAGMKRPAGVMDAGGNSDKINGNYISGYGQRSIVISEQCINVVAHGNTIR
jgi:hypothetical protein